MRRVAPAIVIVTLSCSPSTLPPGRAEGAPAQAQGEPVQAEGEPVQAEGEPVQAGGEPVQAEADIVIDGARAIDTFDRRLLGTNLPAWLGAERFADPVFQRRTLESGTTLLRMPGGSWSNHYDWRACELSEPEGCFWTWAARPSDFADFLGATDIDGMWTVSINDTAHAAAAAVAFFNGSVGDTKEIGVDRRGFDWQTVDTWAQLRAAGGNPDPVGIALWEVGNEVYGGKSSFGGSQCADFGWEEVWTCDGTEYIRGTPDHDGYLTIRAAMQRVDPTIAVGAVGVSRTDAWSGWAEEVIEGAGSELDFYVVHQYGFDSSPSPADAAQRPAALWPRAIADVAGALARAGSGDVPVAVTEYNLVSFDSGDTAATMTTATNALYLADIIGQMATSGVRIANQWALSSGEGASGTNYGLFDVDDDFTPFPQFDALRLWSGAGNELLASAVSNEKQTGLRVYATRHSDGRVTIIALNVTSESLTPSLRIDGVAQSAATIETVAADRSEATTMIATTGPVVAVDGVYLVDLPAWSISAIDIEP